VTAPFDPTAWLVAFTANGGTYALSPEGRLWLGTVERLRPIESFTADLAGHPDRLEAIKALVRERCLIA